MKTYPLEFGKTYCKNGSMYLRSTTRNKDGKEHRYYSIVESRRVRDNRIVQKTILYLGEINSSQKKGWTKAIEVIEGKENRQMSLFADNNQVPEGIENSIKLLMSGLELKRPRQWGACFIANELWDMLGLREFFKERLGDSRKGTRWRNVLQTLVTYRLIDPGSEWRLHRYWYDNSAMGDIL